ncbi:MAG: hypothetical protein HC895_10705 [Leptolyngbyaceae cyanobacterium SM1_3_5]|nr:hypothetical protein [Leptolyngbyaceae cyanobacterium SM1_3_5]
MQITFDISEELAIRLSPLTDQLPQILEPGLRELTAASESGFAGAAEVLEFLAGLPSAEEIIALRPSNLFQAQITELLEKQRTQGLTPAEEQLWEQYQYQYQYLEHLVRIAKAKAFFKLKASAMN